MEKIIESWEENFDEEFIISTKNGLRTAMTDGAIHDYEIRKIKAFISRAISSARAEERARLKDVVEGKEKSVAPIEQHWDIEDFEQRSRDEGYNRAISDILAALAEEKEVMYVITDEDPEGHVFDGLLKP
jgi:hypothetical protein